MVCLDDLVYRTKRFREEMTEFMKEADVEFGELDGDKDEESIVKFVKDKKIDSIQFWFTDLIGSLKYFTITPRELEGAFEEGMGFDGSSIKGCKRINESDMVAFPLSETAEFIPFDIGGSRVIRMFTQIRNPDGSVYCGDPRQILVNSIKETLVKNGYSHMNIGPEAEYFYFFDESRAEPLDKGDYFDLIPKDHGLPLRELTTFADEMMGIPIEYSHHEVGPSQHEIDLKYCEAIEMADRLITHKWLVKEIAGRFGLHATFMPKPIPGVNGSGMHTHLSIFKGEKNAFFSEEDEETHLSDFGKKFLAGVLKHAPEISLITNQWNNSYKRLIPGYEAPIYVAWANRNRSALVRIPQYKPGKEEATRIEARWPDAACNPYLAFAALLRSGFMGVKGNYVLDKSVEVNLYELNDLERAELEIKSLPHDLYEAIKVAERGSILQNMLGEEMFDKLRATKYAHWLGYKTEEITNRELKEGLIL